MADVNVPVVGKVKSTYLYVGGAIVAGIVGYAWWNNKQNAGGDYLGASPDDYGVSDYDSPLGNTGTNSTGNYDETDDNAITTNSQWTQACVETLTSYNFDAGLVSIALGKYLGRQGLTESEVDVVRAAIAAHGPPPVGGPYPINNALPNTPDTPPDSSAKPQTPRLHHVSAVGRNLILQWYPTSNTQSYIVYWSGGSKGSKSGIRETSYTIQGVKPGARYYLSVASVNAAGKRSGSTSNVVSVVSKK